MYELLHGMPAFFHQNIDKMFKNIEEGCLKFNKKVSEEAQDLILVNLKYNY